MRFLATLFCMCLIGFYAKAQNGIRLKDVESEQIITNATVRLVGTNTMLRVNERGEVLFDGLSGKQKLSISVIGYQMDTLELSLPLSKWMVHFLRPVTTELNEVTVNTGYQKVAKERATGSFSLVDNKTFNQQIGMDVLSRLEGITPALSVDRRSLGTPTIMVRGLSTLRGDRTPLIILDDFPYAGDLANLNPNDVESVTVLKDAAAASIWGAKAGNGVIVITTKKGNYNKAMQIDFNASGSINSTPTLNEYNNLNAADAIAVEQMLFGKGYYNSQESSTLRAPFTPAVELMIAQREGKISAEALKQQLAILGGQDIIRNYKDSFFERAVSQQYSLGLRGGSAKMNWYIFSGYDRQLTELGATAERLNLKIDNTMKLTSKLDVGLSVYLTGSASRSGRINLASLTTTNGFLPSYTQFMAADGTALPVMKDYRASYVAGLGGGNLLDWNYYPLAEGDLTPSTNDKWDFLGNLRVNYMLLKGLKIGVNYQYQKQNGDSRTAYGVESYYVRNLVNQYTQINGTTVTRPIPLGAIYNDGQEIISSNNLRGQVNYDGRLGDFSINALMGAEMRSATTVAENSMNYGVDAENLQTVAMDYVNTFKNIVTGNVSSIYYNDNYSGAVNRYVSAYGNAAVNYKGKYTLSASARRDASNVFGVATNDLWNPLWSVGGAWLVSAEKWMQTDYLPYARLRLTYGSSGNSDGKRAAVTTIVYGGTSIYTRTPYANFGNYANPDLRWETVNTLNIGADLKWFNDRLSVGLDYYVKKSKDLIENSPLDYTGGIGFQLFKNAAEISARGLDVEVNSVNLKGAFQWNTSLFANFYKDKVDAYYLSSQAASTFVSGNISGIVGMPVYGVYGYRWAGLNPVNGNPRGYVNGEISEDYATITGARATLADLAYVGRMFPTLTGAIGNSLSWKDFTLDFRIGYKFGYHFRRSGINYGSLYSLRMGDREYPNRWQQAGDEAFTNVPSAIYPAVSARDNFYTRSEAVIVSGDHIRLQYVGLGYTFNKSKFAKLPFRQVTLRTVANNLGLLWRRNSLGIDPDYPGAVPTKVYSFNLQFSL
ncbi:SusC/RagA family TonB-linked outer membrane protein [Pedobacter namyangjuensis]|uniref:SusC/RagA family TonB-linked outer membrane protein n=1 Tax=Pedobacter namyangjuensis TaxID=600626 RepID=UPI000DE32BC8|nr:SusC/RagA family TonB-linked outer membrane protein [Pedobacter namyangjuensis]